MSNARQTFPSFINVPARTGQPIGTPAQQAFQQAIQAVENLREQLRELQTEQAEARRRYWQQVGPVAAQVVGARRALYVPLEEALLLSYFNRLEERQITDFILANARALQERFGEDETAIIQKHAPARSSAASAASAATNDSTDDTAALPPHEQAAAQARNQRKTKASKKQQAAEQAARAEQQRLLSNTKTVYRQLARANHPDLERDLRAEAEYIQHVGRLMQEPTGIREVLRMLSDEGLDTV